MSKNNNILSLVPGKRRMGFAIFRNEMLICYGGKSLSRFKTKAELLGAIQKILLKHFYRFNINHIAIRKLNKSQRSSPLLAEIVPYIKTVSQANNIKVFMYDETIVNRQFCPSDERPIKEKTALFLVAKYLELQRYYKLTKEWQNKYYAYIFQAIAVGLVCLEDLNNWKNNEERNKPNV